MNYNKTTKQITYTILENEPWSLLLFRIKILVKLLRQNLILPYPDTKTCFTSEIVITKYFYVLLYYNLLHENQMQT